MTRLLLLSCMAAALTLSACGKSDAPETDTVIEAAIDDVTPGLFASEEERVADRIVDEMKVMVTALDNVTDEDSAREAARIMNAAGQRIQAEIQSKGKTLDDEKMKAAMADRREEIEAFEAQMESTLKRLIFKPKLAMILGEEMAAMDWSWLDMDVDMSDETTTTP